MGFPDVTMEKIHLQCRRHGFNLWVWKIPGGGHDNPLQYPCLEKSHEQRSLVGYSPWAHKESDTTEQLSTHTHTEAHKEMAFFRCFTGPGTEWTPSKRSLQLRILPMKVKVKLLSRVRLFVILWTVAYQTSPSMGFSRQEDWSGLPFPSPIYLL